MAMDAGCGLSTSGHLDGPGLSTKQNASVAFSIKLVVCLAQGCVMHRNLLDRAMQHGERFRVTGYISMFRGCPRLVCCFCWFFQQCICIKVKKLNENKSVIIAIIVIMS
jgi:hypothetical protein